MDPEVNALTMDQPSDRDILDRGVQGLIGKPLDRLDGPAKSTGAARYASEFHHADLAIGFVLTSTIARGRIAAVDASAARVAPGVLGVLLDHPLLASQTGSALETDPPPSELPAISHYGQAIGVVIAETFEAARAAASLVRVSYEEERAPRTQLAEEIPHADPAPKTGLIPNVKKGDVEADFAASPVKYEATFTTPHHFPAALEPHATVALWRGDALELRSCLQVLRSAHTSIVAALKLDPAKLRILAPYVGGGFGGKTGVGPEVILTAVAARRLGRPVKLALTRRQIAHLVHHRSETRQRVRIGCDAKGSILAIAQESIVTQKDDKGFVEPVALGSLTMYAGAARSFSQALVRLDLPTAGAVRAPGEAIGSLALETAMDELAETLGLDPIAFRKLNEPPQDPQRGVAFSSRRLADCYDEGARRFGWDKRNPTPGMVRDGDWLIGLGMAAATRINLLVQSEARVTLSADGRAIVETDMTDIGTGTYTILAQIAGEMLGLPIDLVEVRLGDTNYPPSAGSGGSFGAASSGSSVALACETLIGHIARLMEATPDELVLKDGIATARNRQSRLVDLLGGADLSAHGLIKPGKTSRAFNQGTYGAQFAEAAVHCVTGEMRVRRMTGVFDCGRILNAKTARSQALGGMVWGLSYALHEGAVVDHRTGAFVTRDFADYHVPVHADTPEIDVHFIEESDIHANPIGVKGLGELTIAGAGAAVANAVYNACGVRVRSFPLTLDKILPNLEPLG